MKKGMKRISLFLAAIMLMSLCIGCGQKASDPPSTSEENADMIAPDWKGATLTLGTLNPEGNADSVAAQWFADQLSEKTGGRLKVNVYPHAQLGNQSVQIEALTMGTQDFFIGGMEPFASIAKELQVLTVFFLFENQEQFQKFFTTQYYADAEAKLAENNIVAINKAYNWVKGPYRHSLRASSKKEKDMKIYKNARILTLAEKGLIESGVVVVDGAKIAGVYDAAEFDATQYPTAEVIDLGGKFVMPGLINGHHHSAMWRNYGKITAFNHDSATQALMCARLALSALRHGILAIRDLGHKGDGHMQLKECRDRGVILAPKIRGAGELIGMDWGTAPSFTNPCKTPEDVRAEVMRQAAHKSDFIKVIANNERMTHIDYEDMTCPWFTQEMMDAAVETAHMCGLKVAVHANGRTAVNWCINSGADIVEHGRCISLDMAKQMADRGMILCPTLSGQKNNATPGWGRDDIQPRYEKSWPLLVYTMENCMKAGVKMIAGTDCLGTVCQEICLLVEIGGMTPLEAIRCATINNAEVMGMDKEIGTLEPGKCADFIVVDGDPLTNPACLEDNVKFFSLDGKWYDTAWLAAITPECNYWTPGF